MTTASDISAERARIAEGLGNAAARKRFTTRRRRFDTAYSDRRRARVEQLFGIASFIAFVAIPILLAALYFGWIASDQYVTETRFLLAPNKASVVQGGARVSGAPPVEVARDTQVVVDYLRSRSLVEGLESDVGLRRRFAAQPFGLWALTSRTVPDWIAGLADDASAEEVVDYWDNMTSIFISPSSGVVTFRIWAFTGEDARLLAATALKRAEAQVNRMNERVWGDAVARAETLFLDATQRLGTAQAALASARNAAGVLDAAAAASALTGVASGARGQLIALEQQRAARATDLSESSPLIRALDSRIASLRRQIAGIETAIAAPQEGGEGAGVSGATLADALGETAEIETEASVAERQFEAAAERLEAMRALRDAQSLYLHVFVEPAAADEATYPRRMWWTAGISAAGLLLWGTSVGLFSLMRNHLA